MAATRLNQAEHLLRRSFRRNGYVRQANLARRKAKTAAVYKKGWEVRLVVESECELDQVRDLLEAVGFNPGKAFRKHHQWVQPVYGKAAEVWFKRTRRSQRAGKAGRSSAGKKASGRLPSSPPPPPGACRPKIPRGDR